MVYSQFGHPVEVDEFDENTGTCVIRRLGKNSQCIVNVSELKADGGINEIAKVAGKSIAAGCVCKCPDEWCPMHGVNLSNAPETTS